MQVYKVVLFAVGAPTETKEGNQRLNPWPWHFTYYIPGTWNNHFFMVVSIGWFQTFTWKMVVSPNIRLKNGCLEFQVWVTPLLLSSLTTQWNISPTGNSITPWKKNTVQVIPSKKNCWTHLHHSLVKMCYNKRHQFLLSASLRTRHKNSCFDVGKIQVAKSPWCVDD